MWSQKGEHNKGENNTKSPDVQNYKYVRDWNITIYDLNMKDFQSCITKAAEKTTTAWMGLWEALDCSLTKIR